MTRFFPLIGLFLVLIAAVGFGLTWQPPAQTPPDFTRYPAGSERKTAFFNYLRPMVAAENRAILSSRRALVRVIETGKPGWFKQLWLQRLAKTYEMTDFAAHSLEDLQTLRRRVDIVPPSMALAQAANESAWGTSRFAREGNNFFGQWCYRQGCGLVPNARSEGATHEVAAFRSPRQSVRRYMNNINTHSAYRDLRDIRAQLRSEARPVTGLALVSGLTRYSERGQAYVDELKAMIRVNGLRALDD